ncbi:MULTISPECIES: hypothetical protein [Sporosarcina]|uniref:hypothetical protein n=1 Tax=Sporosarcina TaxID=1569 RepID=UPI00129B59E0|nr:MULTISPECIES: hypothetical protein [Sporosarcina]
MSIWRKMIHTFYPTSENDWSGEQLLWFVRRLLWSGNAIVTSGAAGFWFVQS